jgi:hypothetical protein
MMLIDGDRVDNALACNATIIICESIFSIRIVRLQANSFEEVPEDYMNAVAEMKEVSFRCFTTQLFFSWNIGVTQWN